MCGRYAIAPGRPDAWASVGEVFGGALEAQLLALQPRYNVAPSQQIPIIVQDRDTRQIGAAIARWGFVPAWWKQPGFPKISTINARVEEARRKPMWRDAWRLARCLIPATHWYEWIEQAGGKIPHALTQDHGRGFMFAGLYSRWAPDERTEPIHTAAILTRAAAPAIQHLHDRMPVILHPRGWLHWLDPLADEARAVEVFLLENTEMMAQAWPVSRQVNAPRNDGPQLLEPV